MVKNIPASAHPAICHRWRAARPCQTYAPHGSPSPGQGSRRPSPPPRGRGQAGSPQQEPRAAGTAAGTEGERRGQHCLSHTHWALLGLPLCPGQFRLSLGSSRQPQPRASGRWKAQLCALPCLGAGSPAAPAAGTARGRHSLPCRQALLPQLVPLPSPPHGAAWHLVSGWSIPPWLEQSCPALRREMPAGTQGTAAQVYRAHAVQGHRALTCRGTGHCCAGTQVHAVQGCRGHAVPHPPCLHAALPSTSAGRAASPQVSWQRPHLLLSTIRRLLCTRGI